MKPAGKRSWRCVGRPFPECLRRPVLWSLRHTSFCAVPGEWLGKGIVMSESEIVAAVFLAVLVAVSGYGLCSRPSARLKRYVRSDRERRLRRAARDLECRRRVLDRWAVSDMSGQ